MDRPMKACAGRFRARLQIPEWRLPGTRIATADAATAVIGATQNAAARVPRAPLPAARAGWFSTLPLLPIRRLAASASAAVAADRCPQRRPQPVV